MNKLLALDLIKSFLKEDIGTGDLSTDLVFGKELRGTGYFLAKDDGIVCGTDIIDWTYSLLSDDYNITLFKKDGEKVQKGENIAMVEGRVSTLLTCERVVLNLMQLMSGIATEADKLVSALDDSTIKIVDTRKSHPGLRIFEKYAVTCGGAYNHRFALYDGVMLKDNHIAFAGGITKAVELVKSKLGHMVKVEVETESAEQVKEADLLVTSVLIPSARAPKLVSADMVKTMKKGSVIIDIAIDQGGNVETIDRVTTLDNPVFEKYGVLHCAVPNIPSYVPKTASYAYSYAILPYLQDLGEKGAFVAFKEDETLSSGVSTFRGAVTNEALAQSLGYEHTEISVLIGFKVK